ncbi:SMP-30/gluconolactonase/LRE family protein [Streptomyces clavuligerus]|uniref:SMP-30/gluconolactonase/LRE family protein n=3 Tax=Streptomyces clavuligerus TaxID=1901 RepID=UPI00020D9354|nr:SMP-30/gluconolactonase/LRE family protein [Streptomyces clavuligerus]ANW21332.1 gluconolaconase [Streptomyces clavuligerus]AXU15958.1 gluconolaconase [Streptomyces clavuligerus]MBY6306088.1 SMP-30/gluconolactonase/LRE family protein [Streptomyces clavuligerus]QCS08738.1 gluconolaconase [Streptomyces clavuligerus]QPJ91927.1 gluconolaconase [Streptomyces clavuligerus]
MDPSPYAQTSRRTLLRLAAVAGTGGALAAVHTPARAAGRTAAGERRPLPRTLTVHAPGLYPEGVGWDRGRRAFLVSSSVQGTISVVRADGSVTPLVTPFARVSVLGLHTDHRRGRIVAAYSDYFHRRLGMVDITKPPVNGVGVFDLATGAVRTLVPVSTGATIEPRTNDVTVDHHGDIYVTDTEVDTVTRVGGNGEVRNVIRDERFGTPETGPNGIVHHPCGFLLVGRYSGGRLFRIDRPRSARPQVREVRLDRAPNSIDGLALRPDGSLLVVSNDLSTAPGRDAVLVLRSTDGWRTARTVEDRAWPVDDPTTVAVTPYGDYVLSGGLREILTGVPSPTPGRFQLRRR